MDYTNHGIGTSRRDRGHMTPTLPPLADMAYYIDINIVGPVADNLKLLKITTCDPVSVTVGHGVASGPVLRQIFKILQF